MITLRTIIFVFVAMAQLSVPASIVWKREETLKHGRIWKFKTEPVDPVDAVRGRYVALDLEAEKIPEVLLNDKPRIDSGATVYVKLKETAEGFAQVDHFTTSPLAGDDVIKAEAGYRDDHSQRFRFPFDRLWVSEKIAPEAERAYRENNVRGKQNAYVTVRVRTGDAALDQLFINNQPLADYLRTHASVKK